MGGAVCSAGSSSMEWPEASGVAPHRSNLCRPSASPFILWFMATPSRGVSAGIRLAEICEVSLRGSANHTPEKGIRP